MVNKINAYMVNKINAHPQCLPPWKNPKTTGALMFRSLNCKYPLPEVK